MGHNLRSGERLKEICGAFYARLLGRCCEVKAVVDDEFLVKIFQIINIDFETI